MTQPRDLAFKQYLESDEFQQWADKFIIDLAKDMEIPLWLLTSKDIAKEITERQRASMHTHAHDTNNQ